jgi:hypothetical protein
MISLHVKASVCDIAEGVEIFGRPHLVHWQHRRVRKFDFPHYQTCKRCSLVSSFQVLLQDKFRCLLTRTSLVVTAILRAHSFRATAQRRSASAQPVPEKPLSQQPNSQSLRSALIVGALSLRAVLESRRSGRPFAAHYCWARQPRGSFCLAKSK